MSSSRRILGVLLTSGVLSVASTALMASSGGGSDHDRNMVTPSATLSYSGSSDDMVTATSSSIQTPQVIRNIDHNK